MSRITVTARSQQAKRGLLETVEVTGRSDPKEHPEYADWRFVLFGILLLVLCAWIGGVLAKNAGEVDYADVADGFTRFTILFVLALAMERLVEPLSHLKIGKWPFGGNKAEPIKIRNEELGKAYKSLVDGRDEDAQDEANNAADSNADANRIGANTRVVIWAVASSVSMLVTGALGVYLLEIFGLRIPAQVPAWLHVSITGLVVGSGSDALEKLIERVKPSEEESGED